MVHEVVELLAPVDGGLVVDGTVGAGGHAAALLDARPDVSLLGIDRDAEAVEEAARNLASFGDRAHVVRGGFEDLERVLDDHRGRSPNPRTPVCFVLLDLGVSSLQLDEAWRGFSYQHDGPLDMRMDRDQADSALDVVNHYQPGDLRRVISTLGEERFAASIARRIVARRPLRSTGELVLAVKEAIPAPARRRGGHPARRTFQALRLEVNGELQRLADGLDPAFACLAPGGRLAVLAYHSLEDRIVKRRFVSWAGTKAAHPDEPPGLRGFPDEDVAEPRATLVRRRAGRPSPAECEANPRCRSARLRAVERR